MRVSVLLLYRRIFDTRLFKLTTYLVGGFTLAWWVTAVLVPIFQCYPISEAWHMDLRPTAHCINFGSFWYAIAGINLALDVATLVMPLCMVWNLQLASGQKVILMGIFLLGGL